MSYSRPPAAWRPAAPWLRSALGARRCAAGGPTPGAETTRPVHAARAALCPYDPALPSGSHSVTEQGDIYCMFIQSSSHGPALPSSSYSVMVEEGDKEDGY